MNSIGKTWRIFLEKVLKEGKWGVKDDGDEILEVIDNHCFIPNVLDGLGFNVNINRDMFADMIGNGVFDIDGYPMGGMQIKEYVNQLNDSNQIWLNDDDSFVYTYPERLFAVCQVNRSGEVFYENQIDVIIHRLKEHIGSNRAVANLYMCGFDKNESHIPCLNFLQCLIRDGELYLHILFRSNDLFNAFPSNMFFLQYLGMEIVENLKESYPNLKFGGIYYNSTSLHIYKNNYEEAKKVVEKL